ncbi:MAG: YiiX/YebB-like N1pC/P60 family cysteine hydrolase, partial [Bdellovibrionota bacterium]
MNLLILVLTAMVLGLACSPMSSTNAKRYPASSEQGLREVLFELHDQLATPVETHRQCFQGAERYYQKLFTLSSDSAQLLKYNAGDIEEMVQATFKTKLIIREYLKQLDFKQSFSDKCYHSVRALLRALRYAEDYLVELNSLYENISDEKKYVTLSGKPPYLMVNPNLTFRDHNDLQSGDVILSRGNAYTSAAIARIGEDDAQFSHVSFVYKDPKGKLWTSEAHIEIGSVVAPIETHLAQGNARTVVFRFQDQAIAHKAAEYMFKLVQKKSLTGKNVPYDFGMNYKDSSELFCSEVVSKGFMDIGNIDVPMYKTKFAEGLIPFLQQLGIKVDESTVQDFETFAPGDLEVDARFSVVAEWRNPLKMKQSRMKDAILTKMFEWMEKLNYKFETTGKMTAQVYMVWV